MCLVRGCSWPGVSTVPSQLVRTCEPPSVSIRFTARVWPGITLTIDSEVTGVDDETVDADISVTRQTSEKALPGDVTVATRGQS